MICAHHHEREAVGLCGSCHRGLCVECARPVGHSLACPGECEQDVATDEASMPTEESVRAIEINRQSISYLFLVIGLLLLSWSIPDILFLHDGWGYSIIFAGFIYLLCPIFAMLRLYISRHRRR